eukprot:CAMPEP_0202907760 /NCGR_PEP_ID=MMETSP1392-20130828/43726_1 /ASSEMBLY_ACC=CAM_ASM_000868 /TAXON_ID=225041 /ORGANISM="Chlamydomonas chlamydogama, Strain SAG 11-48b" /LENGTH=203 /DNA_ID=CAMNT_0049596801 /DNA_START=164 /DNA_END=771 /DNA_ORIENTATION=+
MYRVSTRRSGSTLSAREREIKPPEGPAILHVNVLGDFMTKLEALLRRLVWLRTNSPDDKSLVFTMFPDFLKLVGKALDLNGIGHVSFVSGRNMRKTINQFQVEPEVRVFLLGLHNHCAGLTLVRANHVFLLEPSLDPAVEQQAVARVHRIGQNRETIVTRLLVDGTVEMEVLKVLQRKQRLFVEEGGLEDAGLDEADAAVEGG